MSGKALGTTLSGMGTFDAITPGTCQTITTSGSSQQSAAFSAETTIIRLYGTTDSFIAIGVNPTAATTTMFLPLGTVEYFAVKGGDKVAVRQSTAAGTFYICEGSV